MTMLPGDVDLIGNRPESTFNNYSAARYAVNLVMPLVVGFLGILLPLVLLATGAYFTGAASRLARSSSGAEDVAPASTFGFDTATQGWAAFVQAAQVSQSSQHNVVQCLEASGLTIEGLGALEAETTRKMLLVDAGVKHPGDQLAILACLSARA